MQDKVCLNITQKTDFAISQGMYFPLIVLISDNKLLNWYYVNYMQPVAKLDGINRLSCTIADSYSYGSEAGINGKIMRFSNIDINFCSQVQDIVWILKKELTNDCYCILFLDYFHLESARDRYHQVHYIHEIMIYGYDDNIKVFSCIGFLNKPFQQFELSYAEVVNAFKDAVRYMPEEGGWGAHMCMTLQLVKHKENYPYDKTVFERKFKEYRDSVILPQSYHEQLLYLETSPNTKIAAGREITGVFCEYIYILEQAVRSQDNFNDIDSQMGAFGMYREYHRALLARMIYYVRQSTEQDDVEEIVNRYQEEVVKKCEIIAMVYVKLFVLMEQRDKAKVLLNIRKLRELLFSVEEKEKIILEDFYNARIKVTNAESFFCK